MRLDVTEECISDLEERIIEVPKQKRKKKRKKMRKHANIYIVKVLEGEEREKSNFEKMFD